MAWNDPLRRYEMAERLRQLREAEDRPPPPDGAVEVAGRGEAVVPVPVPRLFLLGVSSPARGDPWWSPRAGATEHALRVFCGPDGRALAWVLSDRTALPLIVVEERPFGSKTGLWIGRHVALDLLDGQCLDVMGPRDRDDVLSAVVSTHGSRRRLVRLARQTCWSDVAQRLPGPVTDRWEDSLTEATADAVVHVATGLAVRHGLVGHG